MARVKRAVNAKKHHKAILEEAKGYYGDRSRTFRSANQAVQHAGVYAFRDRVTAASLRVSTRRVSKLTAACWPTWR
jgi:large subunit ribosomal protein L20